MRLVLLTFLFDAIYAPSHPLVRLRRLEKLSGELMDESFSFLKQRHLEHWKEKFTNNVQRMERSWKRGMKAKHTKCGSWGFKRTRRNVPPGSDPFGFDERRGPNLLELHNMAEEEDEEDKLDWRAEIHGRFTRNKPCLGQG